MVSEVGANILGDVYASNDYAGQRNTYIGSAATTHSAAHGTVIHVGLLKATAHGSLVGTHFGLRTATAAMVALFDRPTEVAANGHPE